MTELARREQFLFQGKYLGFYWIEDLNCMIKYMGGLKDIENDGIVMFTREKNSKGELIQNPRLVNRIDINSL